MDISPDQNANKLFVDAQTPRFLFDTLLLPELSPSSTQLNLQLRFMQFQNINEGDDDLNQLFFSSMIRCL
ncbi:hypothetical protein C5167_024014 [Papaver somniferum]|uniref:Uncharacterized protein n=1 Tax=Papaver somniferum TaxID=3469 RepID=A0A4Y7JQD0_PAPSO|nr:hypothetical protein C5167_024014 [Papaver somniferum]